MDKKYIKSKKIKKSDKVVYVVNIDSSKVEVEYLFFENKIKIFIDGALFEESLSQNIEKHFTIENETHHIKISKSSIVRYKKELEIFIDGKPVENTPADPYFFIAKTRIILVFYFFIMVLKIIFLILRRIDWRYYLSIIFSLYFYFILAILLLIISISYKKTPKFSIIFGLVIAIVEALDYVLWQFLYLTPLAIINGMISLSFWILWRVCLILLLIKAAIKAQKL
ncbi:MAG: hypothetical protein N2258_03365 [Brevinematales bacterium]|nr:hypothetical protein [Brevinematales bacterium]